MSTSRDSLDQSKSENSVNSKQSEMPGNLSLSPKRSVCPTVSYLPIFPENSDVLKPNESNEESNGIKYCQPLSTDKLHTGKYLELNRYSFQDSAGNARSAEGVHMVKNAVDQKPQKKGVPAKLPTKLGNLCTIAVLKRQIMCDSLVLTKQYRAPLRKYTIEFPASVSIFQKLSQVIMFSNDCCCRSWKMGLSVLRIWLQRRLKMTQATLPPPFNTSLP